MSQPAWVLYHSCAVLCQANGGFPGGARGKEPTYQSRRHKRCGFDPWVGKISWRRAGQPTSVFLLENPMDRGAWQTMVHRVAKSQTRLDLAHTHALRQMTPPL